MGVAGGGNFFWSGVSSLAPPSLVRRGLRSELFLGILLREPADVLREAIVLKQRLHRVVLSLEFPIREHRVHGVVAVEAVRFDDRADAR